MKPEEVYRSAIVEIIDYIYESDIMSKSYMIARLSGALANGDKMAQEKPTATDLRHAIQDAKQSPHGLPRRRRKKV